MEEKIKSLKPGIDTQGKGLSGAKKSRKNKEELHGPQKANTPPLGDLKEIYEEKAEKILEEIGDLEVEKNNGEIPNSLSFESTQAINLLNRIEEAQNEKELKQIFKDLENLKKEIEQEILPEKLIDIIKEVDRLIEMVELENAKKFFKRQFKDIVDNKKINDLERLAQFRELKKHIQDRIQQETTKPQKDKVLPKKEGGLDQDKLKEEIKEVDKLLKRIRNKKELKAFQSRLKKVTDLATLKALKIEAEEELAYQVRESQQPPKKEFQTRKDVKAESSAEPKQEKSDEFMKIYAQAGAEFETGQADQSSLDLLNSYLDELKEISGDKPSEEQREILEKVEGYIDTRKQEIDDSSRKEQEQDYLIDPQKPFQESKDRERSLNKYEKRYNEILGKSGTVSREVIISDLNELLDDIRDDNSFNDPVLEEFIIQDINRFKDKKEAGSLEDKLTAKTDIPELIAKAEQGDPDAQYELGKRYLRGAKVSKNEKKAAKWFTKAAEQGFARAQYLLGLCYLYGEGVEKDKKKAAKWFTKAAEQGFARAQKKLAELSPKPEAETDQDIQPESKTGSIEESTEEPVDSGEDNILEAKNSDLDIEEPVETDQDIQELIAKAEQGDPDAQYELGICYLHGEGVERNEEEAVKWLTEAAEQGHVDAQYELGIYYTYVDYEEAAKWLTEAAEQGHVDAQKKLAELSPKLEEFEEIKQTLKEMRKELKEMEEEINQMPEQKRKKFLEGFANLGFRTTELKSKIIGGFLGKISKGMSNKKMATFFSEYEKIYQKAGERAKAQRLKTGKGKLSRLSGLGQGIGNMVKYARVFYDLNILNPFRHVMAASMFIGRTSEAVKETRLQSEEVKEKTRVDDIERAADEAWTIYEEAKVANNGQAPSTDNLKAEYKKRLPQDLIERLNRAEGVGIGFVNRILNKDIKWAVDRLQKKLEKIENNNKLTSTQKEEKKQLLLARSQVFLEDLDRMVADEGMIDNIAYYSRMSEKTGKAVSTAMVIDSLERFSRLAPQLYELIHEKWLGEGELAGFTGFKRVMGEAKSFWKKQLDRIINPYSPKPIAPAAEPIAPAAESTAPAAESTAPAAESTSSPHLSAEDLVKQNEAAAMKAVGKIERGDSVWSVAKRYLDSRIRGRLAGIDLANIEVKDGPSIREAYETFYIDKMKDVIVANPEKYGLPANTPFEKLTAEQLKNLDLNQAFKDAFPSGMADDVLAPKQIQSIVNNNEALKQFFQNHPKAPRNVENFDAILKGQGDTGEALTANPAEEASELTPEQETRLEQIEAQISEKESMLEAQVNRAVEKDIKEIYSSGIWPFKGSQIHEWMGNSTHPGIRDLEVSHLLVDSYDQADFGEHFGNHLDIAEINNRKGIYEYLQNIHKESGVEPKSGETTGEYIHRAQMEIAKHNDQDYNHLLAEQIKLERPVTQTEIRVARSFNCEHDSSKGVLKLPSIFADKTGKVPTFSPEGDHETIVGYKTDDNGNLVVEVLHEEGGKTPEIKDYRLRITDDKIFVTEPGQKERVLLSSGEETEEASRDTGGSVNEPQSTVESVAEPTATDQSAGGRMAEPKVSGPREMLLQDYEVDAEKNRLIGPLDASGHRTILDFGKQGGTIQEIGPKGDYVIVKNKDRSLTKYSFRKAS